MSPISKLLTSLLLLALSFTVPSVLALDLQPFVVPDNPPLHYLSTGEAIRYTSDGSPGPASPKRMYKNQNYEQFFYNSSHIYRREDTSWATPSWQDVRCSNGDRGAYTLARCTGASYPPGSSVTNDGITWIPSQMDPGQIAQSEAFDVVPISAPSADQGNRTVCSPTNVHGYPTTGCSQRQSTQFVKLYAPGEFKFCTRINGVGITNSEDLIELKVLSGPGSGDTFYYMRHWGFVGFKAPGFLAGLMLPGADSTLCTNPNTPKCDILHADAPPIYIADNYRLSPPDKPANNLQDLHHDNVSNNIEQQAASGEVVECVNTLTFKEAVNLDCQTTAPDGSCTQRRPRFIDYLRARLDFDRQKTNNGTRSGTDHSAKVPLAKLEMDNLELKKTIHSFDDNYVGYYSKAMSFQDQEKIKDERLQEAVKNRQGQPSKNLDEQVAWGCGTQCVSIGCDITPDCRPVWMSEIAYRLNKSSDPILSSLYSAVTPLDSQCYTKIYQLLEIANSGSIDTLVKVENETASGTETKTAKQAVPQLAVYANNPAQNFLRSNFKPIEGDPCAYVPKAPAIDKPSRLTLGDVLIGVFKLITESGEVSGEKTAKTAFPKEVVEGVQTDDTFYSSLLRSDKSKKMQEVPASSVDQNQSPVHLGNRNEQLHDAIYYELTPRRLQGL